MSHSAASTPPHPSKEAFLSHGLETVLLSASLDCSICREPLAIMLKHESCGAHTPAVLSIAHAAIDIEEGVSGDGSSTTTSTTDELVREQAVRISSCNHIFGCTCLEAWFNTSKSNRCPECNEELFPNRHMILFLRNPTRAERLKFADCIEYVCNDLQAAEEIRENLMSHSTHTLIREFAMQLWRQQGYEVDCQYIDGADANEEGAETEVEDTSANDDSDDEDETGEMTIQPA